MALQLPVSRVFAYTVPVMVADQCSILLVTTAPLLLGFFSGVSEVALFQVVVPAVALNNLVAQTFGVLFEPAASRLQTSNDRTAVEALYWRSAAWVAVLSFPAFAVCFAAAEPLTVLLFSERYAAAAPILSLLAVGTFVDVSLGFNGAALRVLGKVRWLMAANGLGVALNIVLNLALIPRMGALGAALATGTALIAVALMKQAALHLATGIRWFDLRYASAYLAIATATTLLGMLRWVGDADATVLFGASALAGLAVLFAARRVLSVGETFPELARVPWLRRLLG
jgi:O-antigen/teichoic acid export membrane protein